MGKTHTAFFIFFLVNQAISVLGISVPPQPQHESENSILLENSDECSVHPVLKLLETVDFGEDWQLLLNEVNTKDISSLTLMQDFIKCYSARRVRTADFIVAMAERDFDVNMKDDEGESILHFAVRAKDRSAVKALLSVGANPNTVSKKEISPLDVALEAKDSETAEILIENDADVDMRTSDGNSYVHRYVKSKNIHALLVLHKAKADFNGRNEAGSTPLDLAIEADSPGMVNFLVRHGARLTAKAYDQPALIGKKFRALKSLVDNGMSPQAREQEKTSLRDLAIQSNDNETLEYLATLGVKFTELDKNQRTPLMKAVNECKKNSLRWLLSNGANPNETDSNRNTILHIAAKQNCVEGIKVILASTQRPDIEAKNSEGETALYIAANEDHIEAVKALSEGGADPNAMGSDQRPITDAVRRNSLSTVEALLDAGAQVDALNSYGNSALLLASDRGYLPIVKLLISHGANIHLVGKQLHETPIEAARGRGRPLVVEELEKYY